MKVLAIDSSGQTASVAVVEDTQTLAEYNINREKKTHSQALLPMIDEMVKMLDLDLHTIDAIAVAGGPGSFTGLRIGSATAKGLGLALGKPLIHVPTLDALAYGVYGCRDIICPIMDARRDQVYTGIYSFSAEDGQKNAAPVFRVLEKQMAVSVEELADILDRYERPVVFLGDGVLAYGKLLRQRLKVPCSFAPSYMDRQRAAVVGALGICYYKIGKYETAAAHRPEYLRLSQAERERAEREKAQPVIVRGMEASDTAAVAEMEYQCFSDPWSEAAVTETLQNPQTLCLVVELAGRIEGYLLAYIAQGEAEIARIAVTEDARRQGRAGLLLKKMEEICRETQIRKILLDVRESNLPAKTFYEKHGFAQDGIRRDFYQDPCENALLMSRDL